jgi:superfamily II DNA or RNA helicase
MTILDLRGRDLIIAPPQEYTQLPTPDLVDALFGDYLPQAVREKFGRDKRTRALRTLPMNFPVVKCALQRRQTPFTVNFEERPELPFPATLSIEPRPYQEEALTQWIAAGSAGVVVLPTGAGKTFVAAMALAETGLRTLVVVPTIDLLQQWRVALTGALALQEDNIGVFGGGAKDLKAITIMTYDSAVIYPRELRHFGLLIFDECHHLPAPTYRQIAECAFTPLRLGLSATPERSDLAHVDLDGLIGPEVYRRSPAELTEGRFLAQYQEEIIDIALSDEDARRYSEQRAIYTSFLRRRHISIRSPEEFQQKLIFLSARDGAAREAMLAWRESRNIAMNAPAKYSEIERLLRLHAADQVLLFSEYNEERRAILERFRAGQYSKLVTGRVLNEGVDVPDCRVAIIVSGNSTKREYIQRLGRVLRPKSGQALLYELVTTGTTEEDMAKRRKQE